MIIGASGVLSTPSAQLPRCSRRPRRAFPVKAVQNKDAEYKQQGRPVQVLHGALLAAVLSAGMGLALPQDYMPAARAENGFVSAAERRKQEAQQRKELLAKAREDALRKGSVDAPETTGSAPEPAPAAVDLKVEAANAEVEASNKQREGLSASMLQRLKKAAGDYEKTAGSGFKAPKERDTSGEATWSSLFQKAEEPAKTESPPPAPAPALAAPQGPSLPFQMPKFQAPTFEKVQVPSFGTRQEPIRAPVAPPSPSPAPAAKQVVPPPTPPPPPATPAPAVERAAPSPTAPADEDSFRAGAFFKSLVETPAKPEAPVPGAPKAEAPKPSPLQGLTEGPLPRKAEPAKQEKSAKKPVKAAAVASKPGKRKGPLPLWLAELLVIFGTVGTLYAVIRWNEQLEMYWGKLAAVFESLHEKIDKKAAPSPKA